MSHAPPCALPWHRHRRRGMSGKNGDLPNVLGANEVTVPSLARSCPSFLFPSQFPDWLSEQHAALRMMNHKARDGRTEADGGGDNCD